MLIAQTVALEAIHKLRPVVEKVRRRDRDLADQLRRAASSVVLNAAEARGTRGGNRRLRFETALGSATEASSALEVAVAWGYVAEEEIAAAEAELDRARALLWKLARPA